MKIMKNLLNYEVPIRTEKDFPKEGVEFIDITPVFADTVVYADIINSFVHEIENQKIDFIVSPEARGFWFGCPVANKLGCGFIPVRKKGKLPPTSIVCDVSYEKEYGTDTLCIPKLLEDSFKGKKVYIVDDIYATGNTAKAIHNSLVKLGATVVGTAVFINITELNDSQDIYSIMDIHES